MSRRTASDPSSPKPAKAPREPMPVGFWPIWITVLTDMIGLGVALPILGIYASDKFGANGLQVGVIGAAYSAGQFLFSPILGKLSDRIGRKPLLLLSLIGTAIAATMTGLAGSWWLLVVWRFLDGSSGFSFGVASAAISDIAPPQRRSALIGMLGAAFGIGFTVGPALGALLSWGFGDRAPFFFLAGLSALNAVAVLIRVKETRGLAVAEAKQLEDSGGGSGLAKSWREAGLPRLIAAAGIVSLAFAAFEVLFSKFGRDELGLTKNNAGLALAVVGIVSVIVQGGLIGPVQKRVGDRRLVVLGGIGTAIGLVVFGLANGWTLLIPSMIIVAASFGFMEPSLSAELTNRVDPLRRGEVNGVVQSIRSAGQISGPLILGLVYDYITHGATFFVSAALFIVAVLLFTLARGEGLPPTVGAIHPLTPIGGE